ncbi:hypothetical protein A9R16_003415 [Acidiferrobacter thiooxydans]|uniref:hypothetical protein n=1 Tax=Acidiferrobacter thiooxydans TaxID=163359 RepID=UPI001E5001EF|nr:hypothetical protein [Acidiferrobacter thiooxydans]UEO00463.1 hypothetical protein A9R16_003415 [Acidiferrobacter thiooxydans]
MKKIIISHGDKGGVGKSIVATVLVEVLVTGGHPVALIEGDASQPDVGMRYIGHEDRGISLGALPLSRAGAADAAVADLSYYLEKSAADRDVIINLPAGAGETLDGLAESLAAVADALGFDLYATYSLGKGEAPAKGLAKSLESGLMSVIAPHHRIVLFPAFQGTPETFAWAHSPARAQMAHGSEWHEAIFPALAPTTVFNKFLNARGTWAKVRESGTLMVYDKIAIGRWLSDATKALEPILAPVLAADAPQA